MIITGNNEQEINKLKDELAIRFEMKNLGELKHFLGLEISRCKEGILVSQGQYAKKIIEIFKMINCRPAPTPMEQNLKLKANIEKELKNVRTYRTLVGSLIYLTITRPDISFSVGVVSQFMQKPRKPHLDAANRILRYLKHTINYGLMYKEGADILLSGFTDADWAGDPSSRRSTSGYTFNLGSVAISWCSKKQATVAISSTEAEYNAATLASQECVATVAISST
ncbi:secreted RxLR effector protein 161-like [Apium graveolens]|uniref:secreted RxLR effector protein 161-like n=1 Tax=Apium graveolens TaxID=4045 RepID=UPI003D7ADCD7